MGQVPEFEGKIHTPDTGDNNSGTYSAEKNWIDTVDKYLRNPMLSIIVAYVAAYNIPNRKSLEAAVSDFKKEHKIIFYICFFIDILLRLLVILFILTLAIRALGLGSYFMSFVH